MATLGDAMSKIRHWAASAGIVFVAAWLVGLIIAPSSPAFTAPAAEVREYFLINRQAAILQVYILDCIAGHQSSSLLQRYEVRSGGSMERLTRYLTCFWDREQLFQACL